MTKLDEKLRERDLDQGELHTFKSEVYDYLQSKLKQLTKAYSPKINHLYKQFEALEEKLRQVNDINNDADF